VLAIDPGNVAALQLLELADAALQGAA